MASIKKPKVSKYNFTQKEINLLQYSGSLHPGNTKNLRVFWPLYLESHTNNVHVFNFTLVYRPGRIHRRLYFDIAHTPQSLEYIKANLGKKLSNKRFFYITLVIRSPDRLNAHANGLLYDTETQILERFEPHGSENPLPYVKINPEVAKLMKIYLSKYLGITIKRFNQPKSMCPKRGWQVREGFLRTKDAEFNRVWKIGGYCAAWSLYFIILRAHNPSIPSKKLQEAVFENYETTGDYIHDFYYDFLRWKVEILKFT